jgi:hypothetical protein
VGQEPDRIRAEIEQTRAAMTETVDALGYKADVKTRAKENLQGKSRNAASVAQQNPLGLAIGSVAVGFLAGMLIPSTTAEDEKIGPLADDVKDKVRETGQEALEHGKQVAQDVAESAQETAKQSGQQHAQEVKESARDQSATPSYQVH